MIKKIVEPTGDLCVKFTDSELETLGIKEGDKFSIKTDGNEIVLRKYSTLEIDLSEFNRESLEFLIHESCEKDISINDVISSVIEHAVLQTH